MSETYFLGGVALHWYFLQSGKAFQCTSGCNTAAAIFDICQYLKNLTFDTNTKADTNRNKDIILEQICKIVQIRTQEQSAALRPKPRVSKTKWDAASSTDPLSFVYSRPDIWHIEIKFEIFSDSQILKNIAPRQRGWFAADDGRSTIAQIAKLAPHSY